MDRCRLLPWRHFSAGCFLTAVSSIFWGPRLATLLTFVFFSVYLVQLNLNNIVPPAVNLLALLLSIRLVTEKQGRHYLQIFVLSLFCLAGSSLLSLNMIYLPALILMVAGVTIGLVLLTFFHRDPSLRLNRPQIITLLKTAAVLPIGSLLLMMVLFVILPTHPVSALELSQSPTFGHHRLSANRCAPAPLPAIPR